MFGRSTKTKSPTDQKQSVLSDLIALQGLGSPQWSGRDTLSLAHLGYRRNVVAYRCVQMIIDAAASVPLHVCDGTGPLHDHSLCRLLNAPNPDQTGQNLLEAVYGHLQLYGNAYVEIVHRDDQPFALFALRPDRMQVETDANGWPSVYTYRVGASQKRLKRLEDGHLPLIHIKLFHPTNDLYGQAPMEVAANAVDVHNSAVTWNKSLLDNAARPSGALIYRGVEGAQHLTGEQFDRLKAELSDTYQGARHAGRPLVLDGGLDWKPMSLSPAEMDFMNLKHSAARDIALAFGVPPMMLGIPGDNTYSNYEQALLAFWRHTVLPLVDRVAKSFTLHLGQDDVEVRANRDAVDALAPSRAKRLERLLSTDVLTDAEKRVALGYPATPEAENS